MKQLLYLTLLLISSITLVDCTFNETGQQEIVDAINKVRRDALPRGANLREVRWDSCLAGLASKYVRSCGEIGSQNINRQSHAVELGCVSSGQRVGETTFYTSAPLASNTKAIEAWIKQIPSYKYDDHTCSFICEDYIQLVWFQTYLVGCATIDEVECGKSGTTFVCDYRMSSVDEFKPYMKGEPCSACEENWSVCNQGLCTERITNGNTTKATSEQPTTTTASSTEQPTTTTAGNTEQSTTTTAGNTEQSTTTTAGTTEQPTTTIAGNTEQPTTTTAGNTAQSTTTTAGTTEQSTTTIAGTTEQSTTTIAGTTEQSTTTTAGTTAQPTTTIAGTTEQSTTTTAGTTEQSTTTIAGTTEQSTTTTAGTTEQSTTTTAGTTEQPTTTIAGTTEQPTTTTASTTAQPTTTTASSTEQPTTTIAGTTEQPTTTTASTFKKA